MDEEIRSDQNIEKGLKEQIIENMIDKLKYSEVFPEFLLKELEATDLISKNDVKETISKISQDQENEDTEAGN